MADLQVWLKENQMIMNDEKTEFITFNPQRYEYLVKHSSIIVGKNIITASLTVTNLGVVLDRDLPMAYQVSKIVRICTYKLRMVNIIRDKLSVHVAERVVNAMVTGNLDYCNSLLHGMTAHHSCRSHATKTAFISSTTLRCLSIHLAVAPEISTSWYQYPISLGFP